MAFDIKAAVADMVAAMRRPAGGQWPRASACVRRAFAEESGFLGELASARIRNEIDDATLAARLREERLALEEVLRACLVLRRRTIQDGLEEAAKSFHASVARAAKGAGTLRFTAARTVRIADRRLNARPDTLDFRDLMYVPTLVEVGTRLPLDRYRKEEVPILDQGQEGACTGFGLATVAHFLLRSRRTVPDTGEVSPRMFYALARRYDEWPGEAYEGSSCRGAMKGWHKHGVCGRELWEHEPGTPDYALTGPRVEDGVKRPLGAYFRVNHKDLVAMHSAISEVGVLYASATVHSGWEDVKRDGSIPFGDTVKVLGGHAFAIVAYDERGFWVQNSWGKGWGLQGFCRVSYEDWLKNGQDVWVARLGVPVGALATVRGAREAARPRTAGSQGYENIRPHVISLGNDGQLRSGGNIGSTPEQLEKLFADEIGPALSGWHKPRLVLYAHGGLVSENAAVQRVAEYRQPMMDAGCYPLAFVWNSDYWSTLKAMLEDAVRLRRPEGVLGDIKDFMLDRLDDALEPLARKLTGKAAWDEMKENAMLASTSRTGGARLAAGLIADLVRKDPRVEIHLVGHSAGSILLGPLLQLLTAPAAAGGSGLRVASCTLWAPACTMSLFEQQYVPAIRDGSIGRFALYTLTDKFEQDDDCARIYNKSLLYLVSNAFEKRARIPILRPDGEPLLGMEKFIAGGEHAVSGLIRSGKIDWVQAPNAKPAGDVGASGARAHGAFDDDPATVASTLARIVGRAAARASTRSLAFRPGVSRLRNLRSSVDLATR